MARAAQAVADDIEEADHEPSLRETIEAARDEVIDSQVEERGAPEGEAQAGGPVRDNSGRFTRRTEGSDDTESRVATPAAQAQPAARPATETNASTAAQPATSKTQAALSLAPQGWTPAAKAKWVALPEDIRQEISRRETDTHRALSQQDEQRAFGKEFAQVAEAHQDIIQGSGLHPAKFFGDVMQSLRVLRSSDPMQKAALIRDLIVRNQVDARLIFGQPQVAQPQGQPNALAQPQAVIPPELRQVATEWNQFKAQQQREAAEREQRDQQQTLSEIEAFRSTPEARFFDAVKDHMVALLQGNAATTLEDAYSQAIWARPDIRAILQQEEQQKLQQADAKRQRTQLARAKGGSVRGGVGSVAPGAAADRSLREELQANFAEARSRV